jgi:hypothetical protein
MRVTGARLRGDVAAPRYGSGDAMEIPRTCTSASAGALGVLAIPSGFAAVGGVGKLPAEHVLKVVGTAVAPEHPRGFT